MTYNVRHEIDGGRDAWDRRRDAIASTIRTCAPDVVGLQETAVSQLSDLRARLSAYEWDGCGEPQFGANNPVGVADTVESVATELTWLSETPRTPGSNGWDGAFPRVLTEATLDLGTHGGSPRVLTVFNTHFDHRGENARRESARLIRRRIDELPSRRPVVLVGDFNVADGSPVERILTDGGYDRSLDDAWRIADDVRGPDTTFTDFTSIRPGRRLDRVFVTDDIEVLTARTLTNRLDGAFLSDHLPVCVDVDLPA